MCYLHRLFRSRLLAGFFRPRRSLLALGRQREALAELARLLPDPRLQRRRLYASISEAEGHLLRERLIKTGEPGSVRQVASSYMSKADSAGPCA